MAKINVAGELNPATTEGVLADAKVIIDRTQNKTQESINSETNSKLANHDNDIKNLNDTDSTLENLINNVKELLDAKVIEAGGVSFDLVPTKDSTNPVTSNGIREAIDKQTESINSNMGVDEYPTFSSSTAYSAGDIVNYNRKLYKFTADHATGAWTGSDVEETDIVKEITNTIQGVDNETKEELRKTRYGLKEEYITYAVNIAPDKSEFKRGFFYANNGNIIVDENTDSSNAVWFSPLIEIVNISSDELITDSSANLRYAFYDVKKTYISGAGQFNKNIPITKPENAVYIRYSIWQGAVKDNASISVYNIFVQKTEDVWVVDADKLKVGDKPVKQYVDDTINETVGDTKETVEKLLPNFKSKTADPTLTNIAPDKSLWKKGFFYINNGNIQEDAESTSPNVRWFTNEIDLSDKTGEITVENAKVGNVQYIFYDVSHVYISGGLFSKSKPLSRPDNSVYVRFANTQPASGQSTYETQMNIYTYVIPKTEDLVIDEMKIEVNGKTLPDALNEKMNKDDVVAVTSDEEVVFDNRWAKISAIVNPLKGKHFFSIGDSHTAVGQLQKYIAEQAGATFHTIQPKVIDGVTYFSFDDNEKGQEQTIGQNNYMDIILTALNSDVTMDYLIFEDTHLTEWGEINNSIKPIQITSKQGVYPQVFATRQDALNKVKNEIADIVSTLGIDSEQAGFTLQYQSLASQVLKFGFSEGETLNMTGEVSVIVDGVKFTRTLTEGMTLEECVFDLNDYEYAEDVEWKNEHKGEHGYTEITLTYTGSLTSGWTIAKLEVPRGCNLQLIEEPTVESVLTNIVYMYYGTDISGLNTASNWRTAGGGLNWTTPNLLIGAIKYLKEQLPTCKIVFLGLPAYRSKDAVAEYDTNGNITNDGAKRADGTIDYRAILNSSTQKNGRIARSQTKKVAEYFGDIQYINVYANSEITPENAYVLPDGSRTSYYDWYNSHCKTEGYNAWGRCVLQFIE